MKIAISGKGGVGKSTVSAMLALALAERGEKVLALDADPDANLAASLGIPREDREKIVPLSQRLDLIEERTGAMPGKTGQVYKLNPEVSDIADAYAYTHRGVALLTLGAIKQGGGGCACPESTFARALVTDLVLFKNETLIMDMEAGIEHLGRGTAQAVDVMLVVLEPGQRSADCALTVERMCREIGVKRCVFVANKVTGEDDVQLVRELLREREIAAFLPFQSNIRNADRDGSSPYDFIDDATREQLSEILKAI
jgi:CO dehydrogenase maturation factor